MVSAGVLSASVLEAQQACVVSAGVSFGDWFCKAGRVARCQRFKRRALPTTKMLDMLMAAAPIMGFSKRPNAG